MTVGLVDGVGNKVVATPTQVAALRDSLNVPSNETLNAKVLYLQQQIDSGVGDVDLSAIHASIADLQAQIDALPTDGGTPITYDGVSGGTPDNSADTSDGISGGTP